MVNYRLNALGDTDFEHMIQALLKQIIGSGTITFGAGRDGGREATFTGRAPYPSTAEQWDGRWIFQVKFHDTDLIGVAAARAKIMADLESELNKIVNHYHYEIDNYVFITNVPLSGVHDRGTLDRIENEIFRKYRRSIPNLGIIGANDVYAFLDLYPQVRRPYLHLLITGDLIAELLTQVEQARSELATTIDMYLRTAISNEQNALLDQAGDVSEDAIPLQNVFFDLDGYLPNATRDALERFRDHPTITRDLPSPGDSIRRPLAAYLLGDSAPDRTVIVGGPGEGKSTIGQYIAQIHRATIIGRVNEIAISSSYVPQTPRIPFRIILKEFAQWLADDGSEAGESVSLDSYIAQNVARLSNRPFNERDLHNTIKDNPTVLILDGLDEVTDTALRRRLVSRLSEFIDRVHHTLKGNLQVIATTRPTNYSDQFDPKTFLHFRLHKLQDPQIISYVEKWIAARALDEGKADRLRRTVRACLEDQQISLLMTTPLQVTILILIINSGGTPPRQREALFNEYLDVIYKREKAKGLDIVKTERELLIGLHKYIGYVLQEQATQARSASATLSRPAYDVIVRDFIRSHDPYSPGLQIEESWREITVDAGERLVLIVESPANIFGFELRSIQEFFAASYLLDTSSDSNQRYQRLAAIAHLPHWRNVALFFAGRVGRTTPGEAANVIEVCKEIDRSGPDVYIRRGAEVALELAAERALGPNRVLQHSLLEHGLGIFDIPLSGSSRLNFVELIRRLPAEDIRDHVMHILEQKLPTLGHTAISNACILLSYIAPSSRVFASNLLKLCSEKGSSYIRDVLSAVSVVDIPPSLRLQAIRALVASGADPNMIGEMLAFAQWPVVCSVAAQLDSDDLRPIREAFAGQLAALPVYMSRGPEAVSQGPDDNCSLATLIRCIDAVRVLPGLRGRGVTHRAHPFVLDVGRSLPVSIKSGNIDLSNMPEQSQWLGWLLHLSLGDVSESSWKRFTQWFLLANSEIPWHAWRYISNEISPVGSLICATGAPNLDSIARTALRYGGIKGLSTWLEAVDSVRERVRDLTDEQIFKLTSFGLGSLDPTLRKYLTEGWDQVLDAPLQPVALRWLNFPPRVGDLTMKEFEQLSSWFSALGSDSPWRLDSYAEAVAQWAVRHKKARSSGLSAFWPMVSSYSIAYFTTMAALSDGSEDDLRFLLTLPQVTEDLDDPVQYGVLVANSNRRKVVLALLSLVEDDDLRVRKAACRLVYGICRAAGEEESTRSAIRSDQLEAAHIRLLTSDLDLERQTGIALYALRPPRSRADWTRVRTMLIAASVEDIAHWIWALRLSAELAVNPTLWIGEITKILAEDGCPDDLALSLTDVLRELLPRESQSLRGMATVLSLPSVGFDAATD